MSAISLDEFKAHLNITRDKDDAELARVLDAAESWVNSYTGGRLGGGLRTVSARSVGGTCLVLPALRFTAVTELVDPAGRTVVPAAGSVDAAAGIVELPHRMRGIWRAVVQYADEVPADLRLAAMIIGRHLWETQRQAGSPEGGRPGFGYYNEAGVPVVGFAIPNRAVELLAPYYVPVTG